MSDIVFAIRHIVFSPSENGSAKRAGNMKKAQRLSTRTALREMSSEIVSTFYKYFSTSSFMPFVAVVSRKWIRGE